MRLAPAILLISATIPFQLISSAQGTQSTLDKKVEKPKEKPKENLDATRIKELGDTIAALTKIESDPQFIPGPEVKDALDVQIHQMSCKRNQLILKQTLTGTADEKNKILDAYYGACVEAKKPSGTPAPPPVVAKCEVKLPNAVDVATKHAYSAPSYVEKSSPAIKIDHEIHPVNSLKNSGNQVSGPKTVQVQYVNPLRFQYALGATTTLGNAPQLPSALVPAVTAFSQAPAPPPAAGAPKTPADVNPNAPAPPTTASDRFDETFKSYEQCFRDHEQRMELIDQRINEAIEATNLATGAYTGVLNSYSSVLLNPGEPAVLRSAVEDGKVFKDYYSFPWPVADLNLLSGSLNGFADQFQNLAQLPGYSDWIKDEGHKQVFTYYQSQIAALKQHLAGLGPSSDPANKLNVAQQSVEGWREQFFKVAHLKDEAFTPVYNVPCNAWFGKSQTTVVKLTTKDLLLASAAEQSADLVSIVCNSPLTVTSGLGFTTLSVQTPAFVAGKASDGTVQQQLGFSDQSNVSPLFALQINTTLHEWYGWGGVGLHASAGAAIGTTGGNGAGANFLFGPSVSFHRRTFFLTPSFLLGQRTEYLTGFKPGNAQGSLTSPPTTVTWKPGFAFTLTFPLTQ
jgi:hypothetical protein